LFKQQRIEQIVDDHLCNRADHGFLLYALIMLELWFEEFM